MSVLVRVQYTYSYARFSPLAHSEDALDFVAHRVLLRKVVDHVRHRRLPLRDDFETTECLVEHPDGADLGGQGRNAITDDS